MTSLLVKSIEMSLPIDLSSLTAMTMSDQQFYEFCRTNPDLRIERNASGEIIVMPPAFADTGNRNGRVFGQLYIWAETDGTGEAFDSSSGFTLPNSATRSPDAAWISSDRWNALTPEQQASFAPIAPDFVVELRSSSDTLTSLQTKMEEYMANGIRLGLLIDRKNFQVHIYRPHSSPEILDKPESVSCEPEMPMFVLKMAKIW
ncbi:Uma2 family endonuclease [Leptolyngbya cf. ectocarpi LEGE 11479]|uniref:Uma2 family endonuclease n=1 Tax=Leptolyngbya cf. ectocarpi LEGE 11479 TaxID=1828722 RepID=A0A928X1A9_LEPEC|nr:Uma2 family endonuclease [Leptolyngbya ectocarpi]MBE9067102.1 Uma2 family endonuclease [Leptolyngbya cf. ectocarpi LEGE 11479]